MNKGFSLVELIVVIAIMAILVGVAVPVYTQYISSAEDSVDKQTAGEVEHAIAILLIDPEIDSPADNVQIKLTSQGLKFAAATDETTYKDFMDELKSIVPNAKSDTEYTFTISGYSVSVNPPLVKNESSSTAPKA
jgi:prepilin-type N-terminal cleavage/methylation domain-containing protein